MSPEEYLERAEHFRKALETAKGAFTRYHLEAIERSFRTLAESEQMLRKSARIANAANPDNKAELLPKHE